MASFYELSQFYREIQKYDDHGTATVQIDETVMQSNFQTCLRRGEYFRADFENGIRNRHGIFEPMQSFSILLQGDTCVVSKTPVILGPASVRSYKTTIQQALNDAVFYSCGASLFVPLLLLSDRVQHKFEDFYRISSSSAQNVHSFAGVYGRVDMQIDSRTKLIVRIDNRQHVGVENVGHFIESESDLKVSQLQEDGVLPATPFNLYRKVSIFPHVD